MKTRKPKYSALCLTLINAVQAAEKIEGMHVIINNNSAAKFMAHLTQSELALFEVRHHAEEFYKITLK